MATRKQLEELYEALCEKDRRRREAPLLSFQPSKKQRQLYDLQASGRRICLLRGSNKCGKTFWSVGACYAHSYGYRFWEVEGLKLTPEGDLPPREQIPVKHWVRDGRGLPIQIPNTGMIVTGLARERGIGHVFWPTLEEFAPPSLKKIWKTIKGPGGIVTQCTLPNGSKWIVGSSDQDPLTFEGTRLQWAAVDEPVPPFVFNGLWRGLAVDGGPIWFTLTPLGTKATWMYLKWVRDTPPEVGTVQMCMRDNPALTEEMIREFEEKGEWDEAERRARLYGEFEALGNRVLYNFNRDYHVVKPILLPLDWIHGVTVDPHHARPPATAWWKKSPSGVYHFYREYPTKAWNKIRGGALTPTELAILFRNIEANDIPTVRIADPRFGKAQGVQHGKVITPWAEQMADTGLIFDTRVPNTGTVEVGEQLIVDMLRHNDKFPISPSNTPKILIHEGCDNLITACEQYGILQNRDPTKYKETRSEEWKDWIDIIRYTVLYPCDVDIGRSVDLWTDEEWRQENETFGGFHDAP
jgi:hypothetical protein